MNEWELCRWRGGDNGGCVLGVYADVEGFFFKFFSLCVKMRLHSLYIMCEYISPAFVQLAVREPDAAFLRAWFSSIRSGG